MTDQHINRRAFLGKSVTTMGAASLAAAAVDGRRGHAAEGPGESDRDVRITGKDIVAKGEMPYGKIGKLKISRLILGSNLMSGFSHSRDLSYVGPLMKAYNSEEKIMETLALAEAEGINTISQGDAALIRRYNESYGGKLQQLGPLKIEEDCTEKTVRDKVRKLVDTGPAAIYVFGHAGDKLVRAGRTDMIATALQYVRDEGLPAGVGGHSLNVVMECEHHQVAPDFYFKTFHQDNYWSRTLKENRDEYCWYNGTSNDPGHYHDNMWCMDPEKTAEVMQSVSAAWIAFKILAAGAIHPSLGFNYALRHGADFLVVGMFDFQVQDNARQMRKSLKALRRRDRPWRA